MAEEPKDPSAPSDSLPPVATETWVKSVLEGLTNDERKAALKAATRALHEDDLGQLSRRTEAITRERDRYKKALDMQPEERDLLTDAEKFLDYARASARVAGVSEAVLKFARTPADVEQMITDLQASAPTPKAIETRYPVAAEIAKPGLKPPATEPKAEPRLMPAGAGTALPSANQDNIDALWVEASKAGGPNPYDKQYRDFLAERRIL